MQVVSVNVSATRTVQQDGRDVTTGIYKQPVPGPVAVLPLNLVGDDQADRVNHGGEHKAVYAFGQQHHAHWQQVLERDALAPGFFGENLTIDELDEHTLFVGDQLRIGTVVLQITQPRVPCFKLGLKAEHRRMPRLFVQHGLTGVYLRVLQQGELAAGDPVSVEPAGTSSRSLATLFAAVHDPATAAREETLREALDNPALSTEWRQLIEQRLERIG